MTNQRFDRKKQIIVTGGLGFIGQHLIQTLIRGGYFPIVIDRLSQTTARKIISHYKLETGKDFVFLRGDIRNAKWLEKKLRKYKPYAAIHLAALHFIPYCDAHRTETVSVNVHGTQTVLELCRKMRIRKFLLASSAAVYKPSMYPHTETDITAPIDVYGTSKKMAEDLVLLYAKLSNMQPIIMRIFNVYGSGDRTPHLIPSIVKQANGSKTILHGNLQSTRDYIYVDDVVAAMMRALIKPKLKETTYNLGTGKGSSGTQVIKTLSRILRRNVPHRISPAQLRRVDRKNLVANIDAISKELRWNPRYSLREGLLALLRKE